MHIDRANENEITFARLQAIASVLNLPISTFFGAGQDTGERVAVTAETYNFLHISGAARLLRAYAKLEDATTRQRLISFAETMAHAPSVREPQEPT